MAKYTVELGTICESMAGNQIVGASGVAGIIATARPKIFDFEYPQVPAVNYEQLEKDFLLHFYTREIGFETYGLWKLRLMQFMREKMGYFNSLYESTMAKYNPLGNVLYKVKTKSENGGSRKNENVKEYEKGTTDTTTNSGTDRVKKSGTDTVKNSGSDTDTWSGTVRVANSGSDVTKRSDTPQGGLVGLRNDEYLTEAAIMEAGTSETTTRGDSVTKNHGLQVATTLGSQVETTLGSGSTTKRTGSDTDTERLSMNELFTEEQVKEIEGKIGDESFSKLLMEYREALLNVNELLFEKMDCLFMGIW